MANTGVGWGREGGRRHRMQRKTSQNLKFISHKVLMR